MKTNTAPTETTTETAPTETTTAPVMLADVEYLRFGERWCSRYVPTNTHSRTHRVTAWGIRDCANHGKRIKVKQRFSSRQEVEEYLRTTPAPDAKTIDTTPSFTEQVKRDQENATTVAPTETPVKPTETPTEPVMMSDVQCTHFTKHKKPRPFQAPRYQASYSGYGTYGIHDALTGEDLDVTFKKEWERDRYLDTTPVGTTPAPTETEDSQSQIGTDADTTPAPTETAPTEDSQSPVATDTPTEVDAWLSTNYSTFSELKVCEQMRRSETKGYKERHTELVKRVAHLIADFQAKCGDSREALKALAKACAVNVATMYRWKRVGDGKPARKPAKQTDTVRETCTVIRRKSECAFGQYICVNSSGDYAFGELSHAIATAANDEDDEFPLSSHLAHIVKGLNRRRAKELHTTLEDLEVVKVSATYRLSPAEKAAKP